MPMTKDGGWLLDEHSIRRDLFDKKLKAYITEEKVVFEKLVKQLRAKSKIQKEESIKETASYILETAGVEHVKKCLEKTTYV